MTFIDWIVLTLAGVLVIGLGIGATSEQRPNREEDTLASACPDCRRLLVGQIQGARCVDCIDAILMIERGVCNVRKTSGEVEDRAHGRPGEIPSPPRSNEPAGPPGVPGEGGDHPTSGDER